MPIILIAMTDSNYGIGDAKGNLLYKLPKDMGHFKTTTEGHAVVMGRKTYDSLKKKPLPNRDNYVLSRNESLKIDGVTVIHSIEDVLLKALKEDIYIIGGGEVYAQFIPYADKLILTHVHNESKKATTFFPEYSINDWKIVEAKENKANKSHKYPFVFATYERVKVLSN